jgi:uncharacterized membrane protein
MSDPTEPVSAPSSASPTQAAPTPAAGGPTEEGKLFAILSYGLNFVGLPFWIVPVVQRKDEFALYHAKQAMFMWIAMVAINIVAFIVSFVLAMVFAPLGCVGWVAMMVVGVGMLILNILGLVNAINAKQVAVPVLGDMALNMFKSMTVKSGS